MAAVVKVKTGNRFEEKNSYSRVVVVGHWILVAQTAGRNLATGVISPDPLEQCREAVANVEKALRTVGAGLKDIVRLVVRIPDPANVKALTVQIGECFRGIDPAMTFTCTPLAGAAYAVELEATAYDDIESVERRTVPLV